MKMVGSIKRAFKEEKAKERRPSAVQKPHIPRVPSGIPGLDELIEGGFEKGSVVVVMGGPGSGKTIMGVQFLYNGIVKYNEPGILINLEHDSERFRHHMLRLGMDVEKLEKEKKLVVLTYSPNEIREIIRGGGGIIKDAIDQIGAKRVVLDPLSAMIMFYEKKSDMRAGVVSLFASLRSWDMTTLALVEFHSSGISMEVVHPTIAFLADGVINLNMAYESGQKDNVLEIVKMRGTGHYRGKVPYELTDNGLVVRSKGGKV